MCMHRQERIRGSITLRSMGLLYISFCYWADKLRTEIFRLSNGLWGSIATSDDVIATLTGAAA